MTTLTRQDLNFGQGRDLGLLRGGSAVVVGVLLLSCVPSTVVADVLSEFLEVAVHLILYVREVYPVGIFQKRKKYNVPVQVSPRARLHLKTFILLTSFLTAEQQLIADSLLPLTQGPALPVLNSDGILRVRWLGPWMRAVSSLHFKGVSEARIERIPSIQHLFSPSFSPHSP